MASSVFYKFKSQREESRVTFDGTGISVFDLKRGIILDNNLGKANDFDLHISDASTSQEYKDDSTIIPRSSSVIVRRLPAARQGKGSASKYIGGVGGPPLAADSSSNISNTAPLHSWHKGAMSKRFNHKEEDKSSSLSKPMVSSSPSKAGPSTGQDTNEADSIAAMFNAQKANWEDTQEKMTHATRVYTNTRGTGFKKPFTPHQQHGQQPYQSDRPLPPSYVCYRCGQKGHWIQDCPTNNDREFDNKPRIKRTTGIPRSMLKAVENPTDAQGVMVTPEGGYVVAQPDSASWQKQVTRPKGLTAAEVRERTPTDPALVCPIDNQLFRDAVKTPCCGTAYCEECIQTHLLEHEFICPNCTKKILSLDKLITDKPMRTKVTDYIEKVIEDSKKEGAEESGDKPTGDDATTGQPDQQVTNDLDVSQAIVDTIPQLQAQISQLSVMLQNTNLPLQVRQQTELHQHQLQVQLQQAQGMAMALASIQQMQQQGTAGLLSAAMGQPYGMMNMQGGYAQQNPKGWVGSTPYTGQVPVPGGDSAYQRQAVNNRQGVKRNRPAEFYEYGAEKDSKTPKYWE